MTGFSSAVPACLAAFFSLVALSGCKKEQEQEQAPASGRAPAPSAVAVPPGCVDAPGGMLLGETTSVGTAGEPPGNDGEAEEIVELGLPFAVQLGGAVFGGDFFAASALVDRKGASHALLSILALDGTARTVDLGRVFGDVVPPLVAAGGRFVFAAYMDGAASGKTLHLARVDGAPQAPKVVPGASVALTDDETPAFGLAVRRARGIVVWEDFDKKKNRSAILSARFAADAPGTLTEPVRLSREKDDVESPRAVESAGGFWVAWIANGSIEPSPGADPERTLESGPRFLELLRLDEEGVPSGDPIRLTGAGSHVLAFDLVAPDRDGALLVWREDTTSPEIAGGSIHLTRVEPDGSVDARVIADEGVGATVPSLLLDQGLTGKARAFVAFAGEDDATRMGSVDGSGAITRAVDVEPKLFGAAPLSAHAGKVLAARPRGRGAELFILSCRAE